MYVPKCYPNLYLITEGTRDIQSTKHWAQQEVSKINKSLSGELQMATPTMMYTTHITGGEGAVGYLQERGAAEQGWNAKATAAATSGIYHILLLGVHYSIFLCIVRAVVQCQGTGDKNRNGGTTGT